MGQCLVGHISKKPTTGKLVGYLPFEGREEEAGLYMYCQCELMYMQSSQHIYSVIYAKYMLNISLLAFSHKLQRQALEKHVRVRTLKGLERSICTLEHLVL